MKRMGMVLIALTMLLGWRAAGQSVWPERDDLLRQLVDGVRKCLAEYHPETGKFGTEPWICDDQNVIFPLAVAWATPGAGNPYYHNGELLAVIARAGDVLTETQDEKGRWMFRKKDNSEWGMQHKPWTYTRWIRAYRIIKDALPPESRQKWESGLRLGYQHIAKALPKMNIHNIPAYHAAGVYVAGLVFEREDWQRAAADFLYRVMAQQARDGYWSEHFGPVVGYNFVYLDALGIYYHYSRDAAVLDALSRGARFHASLLWSDGTSVSVVDERNAYSARRRLGNVGFSHSPEGRWYLQEQSRWAEFHYDTAASLLYEGGSGNTASPFRKSNRYVAKDQQYSMERSGDFEWCFSAYTCPISKSRWIMDRQNHLEICHLRSGVIAGGGNSKMQPYFSSFSFGDTAAFQPDYAVKDPNFFPAGKLLWTAGEGRISGRKLFLKYGENQTGITVVPEGDSLTVTYRLLRSVDGPAEAHLPLLCGDIVSGLNGRLLPPGQTVVSGRDLGGGLLLSSDLAVRFPDDAVIRPGVTGFNPYHRYGKNAPSRTVITLPLSPGKPVAGIRFEPLRQRPESLMLWNGDSRTVSAKAVNCPAVEAAVQDGALCVSGRTGNGRSMYLRAVVRTPLFTAAGNRLAFDLEVDDARPGDSFYVKGAGVGGRMVFAYRAALKAGRVRLPVVLDLPDTTGDFVRLDNQIGAGPDELVKRLEFHYGRAARNADTSFRIRHLRVESAAPAAGARGPAAAH